MKLFWKNVVKVMALKGISRKELASNVNISTGYLSQLVNNDRRTNSDLMQKVAEYLEIDLANLLTGNLEHLLKPKSDDDNDHPELEQRCADLPIFGTVLPAGVMVGNRSP